MNLYSLYLFISLTLSIPLNISFVIFPVDIPSLSTNKSQDVIRKSVIFLLSNGTLIQFLAQFTLIICGITFIECSNLNISKQCG